MLKGVYIQNFRTLASCNRIFEEKIKIRGFFGIYLTSDLTASLPLLLCHFFCPSLILFVSMLLRLPVCQMVFFFLVVRLPISLSFFVNCFFACLNYYFKLCRLRKWRVSCRRATTPRNWDTRRRTWSPRMRSSTSNPTRRKPSSTFRQEKYFVKDTPPFSGRQKGKGVGEG